METTSVKKAELPRLLPRLGIAHDVVIRRGVAHHRAEALQEDPLKLLPEDAVDHKVHRAVHCHLRIQYIRVNWHDSKLR